LSLDFNYTLLIQFANFLVLLILLNFFLFKPVLKSLARRRAYMQSLSEKVQEENREATEVEKDYEETARERKKPILEQREVTVKEAQASSIKVIEEARRDLTSELDKMKERVKAESEAALQRLSGEADRLSQEAAARILGRPSR
jgi:F-type H+-transporting ATPase subunit b